MLQIGNTNKNKYLFFRWNDLRNYKLSIPVFTRYFSIKDVYIFENKFKIIFNDSKLSLNIDKIIS